MANVGSGPLWASPTYASDEDIAVVAQGDFALLAPLYARMATGADGVFAAGAPWILTSASVNFQAQGVAAQNVVLFSAPRSSTPGAGFPGAGYLYAVDSVSGNNCTLRQVGMQLNVGQPPASAAGLAAVTFTIPSLAAQIEEATYQVKQQFRIDEAIFFRNSTWLYQGAEDAYRALRRVTVFWTLRDCFHAAARGGDESADWVRKTRWAEAGLAEALAKVEARWGPFGNSGQPTNALGCRITR